ncbi:hypothetical protein C8R45DRAFT_1086566 [Mycena sanguinolenta]|nr:hypothetical protein C8R45DRAFT_1086566 [Mycena sanguinolenta]
MFSISGYAIIASSARSAAVNISLQMQCSGVTRSIFRIFNLTPSCSRSSPARSASFNILIRFLEFRGTRCVKGQCGVQRRVRYILFDVQPSYGRQHRALILLLTASNSIPTTTNMARSIFRFEIWYSREHETVWPEMSNVARSAALNILFDTL